MTQKQTNTSRSKKSKDAKAKYSYSRKQAKIKAQDLFNTYACLSDEQQIEIEKTFNQILYKIYQSELNDHSIKLWVDGSFNPKTNTAGIGLVIVTDPTKPIDNVHNIAFGKSVNAKSSLNAEIYALSIGLSYILDTDSFADIKDIHIFYDCVNSTVCATNIDAYTTFGAPYTNFRSALKRIKRRNINVIFEHTKAHNIDENNELCDLIAKYYAKADIQASQRKMITKFINKKK